MSTFEPRFCDPSLVGYLKLMPLNETMADAEYRLDQKLFIAKGFKPADGTFKAKFTNPQLAVWHALLMLARWSSMSTRSPEQLVDSQSYLIASRMPAVNGKLESDLKKLKIILDLEQKASKVRILFFHSE
jgi:hypothetical protein